MRILHLTEASAAGTLMLVALLASEQAFRGNDVSFGYVRRVDSPPDDEIASLFVSEVRVQRVSRRTGWLGLFDLAWTARGALSHRRFDVIHLHSTYAGVIGRVVAACTPLTGTKVFYSPHGFAFLRSTDGRLMRALVRSVEQVLGRVGSGIIALSNSECGVARQQLAAPRVFVVRSGLPSEAFAVRQAPRSGDGRRPRVGMVGRVAAQKAPWRIANVARALCDEADFVWIGGGTERDVRRWLSASPIRVTGWVSSAVAREELNCVDIFLFPTLWEGKPLALMEAQALGIPAVASRVVGNVDCIKDGVTGFLCDSDDELIRATRRLLEDAALRRRMGAAAAAWAAQELSDVHLADDCLRVYEEA